VPGTATGPAPTRSSARRRSALTGTTTPLPSLHDLPYFPQKSQPLKRTAHEAGQDPSALTTTTTQHPAHAPSKPHPFFCRLAAPSSASSHAHAHAPAAHTAPGAQQGTAGAALDGGATPTWETQQLANAGEAQTVTRPSANTAAARPPSSVPRSKAARAAARRARLQQQREIAAAVAAGAPPPPISGSEGGSLPPRSRSTKRKARSTQARRQKPQQQGQGQQPARPKRIEATGVRRVLASRQHAHAHTHTPMHTHTHVLLTTRAHTHTHTHAHTHTHCRREAHQRTGPGACDQPQYNRRPATQGQWGSSPLLPTTTARCWCRSDGWWYSCTSSSSSCSTRCPTNTNAITTSASCSSLCTDP